MEASLDEENAEGLASSDDLDTSGRDHLKRINPADSDSIGAWDASVQLCALIDTSIEVLDLQLDALRHLQTESRLQERWLMGCTDVGLIAGHPVGRTSANRIADHCSPACV